MRILQSIEKNSLRFYNESFEAFFKKKYATAIFLAIFSIEEAAKYVIVEKENRRPELTPKKIYQHKIKHEEIGEFFWYWAIYSVLSETFKDFKSFAENLPKIDSETLKFIQKQTGGDAVDFIRFNMFKNEEEMRVYVKERFEHPELLEVSKSAKEGIIENLRKRCIYVDLSQDRKSIITSPEEISEDEANEWMKIAWFGQEYIKLVKKNLTHHSS
jgi:AbiV family abortive infection protein